MWATGLLCGAEGKWMEESGSVVGLRVNGWKVDGCRENDHGCRHKNDLGLLVLFFVTLIYCSQKCFRGEET